MASPFSSWHCWDRRSKIPGKEFPGIYAIALSKRDISDQRFSWKPEVIYIGMTNSVGGIKSRLQQFQSTILGGDAHGGASRVKYKHKKYDKLAPFLYVAASFTACDVKSNKPKDLKLMGEVAKQEYDCFAAFAKRFNRLPEFNDKKRSPKK